MLMSIPIISPIELTFPAPNTKQLPSPDESEIADADYTVHETTVEPSQPRAAYAVTSPALLALNQVEHAIERGETRDPAWWSRRFDTIRDVVKKIKDDA